MGRRAGRETAATLSDFFTPSANSLWGEMQQYAAIDIRLQEDLRYPLELPRCRRNSAELAES